MAPRPAKTEAVRAGRIRCTDGDPRCDLDATPSNRLCSFAVALCLENVDPRFPRCDATPVGEVQATSPGAASPGRLVLDRLLASLPPDASAGGRCGVAHVVAVPTGLRRNGRPRPGTVRFAVRANVGARRVEASLALRCAPAGRLN